MSNITRKWAAKDRAEEDERKAGCKPSPPDRRTLEAIAASLLEAQQRADRAEEAEKDRIRRAVGRPVW